MFRGDIIRLKQYVYKHTLELPKNATIKILISQYNIAESDRLPEVWHRRQWVDRPGHDAQRKQLGESEASGLRVSL